jgi:hypothetical protein
LEGVDVDHCITRKNLYWRDRRKQLIKAAKSEQNLTSSQQLPKSDIAQIDLNNPFTWVLTVNCSKQILQDCAAQVHPYPKDIAADSLTLEESEFMKTM